MEPDVTVGGEVSEKAVAAREGRWSWAALTAGVLLWVMTVVTFGVALVLVPIPSALSAVAWWRSRRDRVFWIGLASNATLLLGFVGLLIVLWAGNATSE
jgi:hypothetical protein